MDHGTVCTAIPATDTVFELKNNDKVLNIHNQKDKLTDFCKIYTLNKEKVKIVVGDYTNIKITQPNDLDIAKGIINKNIYQGDVGTLPYKIIKCVKNLIG